MKDFNGLQQAGWKQMPTTTIPYLDKSEVNAWLRVRAKRDPKLRKAHEGKAKLIQISQCYYKYSTEADSYFRPQQHGISCIDLDAVVLRFVDPLEQWNPGSPLLLMHWPDFEIGKHHQVRPLLGLTDEELARRPRP
jgi:hypothetical protein